MNNATNQAEAVTAQDSSENAVKHGFILALETLLEDLNQLISHQRQLKHAYMDKGDLESADAHQNQQWGIQMAVDRIVSARNCLSPVSHRGRVE